MRIERRWMTATLKEAAKTAGHKMPWERGARRAAFIAKRNAPIPARAARA